MTKLETHLNKRLEEYRKLLFLEGYKIDIKRAAIDGDFTLQIEVHHPYRDAEIEYGTRCVAKFDEGKLENIDRALLHELVHIIVKNLSVLAEESSRLSEVASSEDEKLTDWLSYIIYPLIK